MKNLNSDELASVRGGTDLIQPLTMPPNWSPTGPAGLPGWVQSTSDYLKYLGILAVA